MSLIKKNIWLVFFIILLGAIVATGLYINSSYQTVRTKLASDQKSVTGLIASSIRANLEKYETIIDVLAGEFDTYGGLPSVAFGNKTLSAALNAEKDIVDVAILKPDGTIYLSLVWPQMNGVTNIYDFPPAGDTFQQTLEETNVVIGRSYYARQLDRIVAPIRKAIRNEEGQVQFVLTMLVDANLLFEDIVEQEGDLPLYSSYVYRSVDRFYQYAPSSQRAKDDAYTTPLPQATVDMAVATLARDHNRTLSELKQAGRPFTSVIEYDHGSFLTTFVYLQEYKLWLITDTDIKNATRLSSSLFLGPVLSVVLFIVIIFALFRVVDRSQQSKFRALTRQANRDFLTGLYNRFYLENEVQLDCDDCNFYLIFIDLDRFKSVNDAYGHAIGDSVLIQISRRLQQLVSERDTLIRYSGDEFIVVAKRDDVKKVEQLCECILAASKRPFVVGQYEFILSASLGVAHYPKDSSSLSELIRHADLAMYESKKLRDSISFFSEFDKSHLFTLAQIEYEIKHALDKDELFVVYQPQVNEAGNIIGVEALIRWHNESLGFVPPDKLIAVAEANGYMEKIGAFVIEESIKTIHQIRQQTKQEFSLSINVSVKQLQNKEFLTDFIRLTEKFGSLNELNLVLEVTENVFIDNVESMKALLVQLRDKGVRIALDDFGTGYSSLSLLASLPLDELKLDKAFIDPVTEDAKAFEMIKSILSIAKALELQTVAEGVEAQQQHDLLCQLGCDSIQGYFHSKPIGKQELHEFVVKHSWAMPCGRGA